MSLLAAAISSASARLLRNACEQAGAALEDPCRARVEEETREEPVVGEVTSDLVDVVSAVFGFDGGAYFDGVVQRFG